MNSDVHDISLNFTDRKWDAASKLHRSNTSVQKSDVVSVLVHLIGSSMSFRNFMKGMSFRNFMKGIIYGGIDKKNRSEGSIFI